MSETSRWSYTNKATVWKRSAVPSFGGGFAYVAPIIIACTWTATSRKATDNGGEEFVASCDFFHEDARVEYGDMIVKGDHSALASPPVTARAIRGHTEWDMSFFDDPMPDYRSTI